MKNDLLKTSRKCTKKSTTKQQFMLTRSLLGSAKVTIITQRRCKYPLFHFFLTIQKIIFYSSIDVFRCYKKGPLNSIEGTILVYFIKPSYKTELSYLTINFQILKWCSRIQLSSNTAFRRQFQITVYKLKLPELPSTSDASHKRRLLPVLFYLCF